MFNAFLEPCWHSGMRTNEDRVVAAVALSCTIPLASSKVTNYSIRRQPVALLAWYHEDRTHIGLEKTTPARRPIEACPRQARNVLALPRIGGLHHRYTWSQAA
jgi:hypothetical protein